MRNLNDTIVTAAGNNGAFPVDFVKIQVDPDDADKIFTMTTAFRAVTFGGDTYQPAGHLMSVSAVDHTQDIKTNPISITVSGIDDTVVAILNSEPVFGATVEIFRSLWDTANNDVVATPYERWSGIIVSQDVNINAAGENVISVTCKNKLEALLQTKAGRFTSPESFSQFNSTDKSMEFVASLTSWEPKFGAD